MIKTGDWTIPQLVKYLAGVKDTLTKEEIERLRQTTAFAKEELPATDAETSDTKSVATVPGTAASTTPTQRRVRYKIGALYEPTDAMRQLGLPVLDWGHNPKWRSNSDEAKFLFFLGLQRYPPLQDLLKLAAGSDPKLRELALRYFLDKFSTQYQDYQPGKYGDIAFIPAIDASGKEFLAKHSQVFSEPGCTVLGFAVIRGDLRDEAQLKLKIFRHPAAGAATNALLQNPPKTEEQAKKVFEYLTNLLGDFTANNLQQLKAAKIIPAETPRSTGLTLVKPGECYFKGDGQATFHSKLFIFIDFGSRANTFLSACGVRNAPTTEEVALMLIADPAGFYSLAGGAERFKAELRQISASFNDISASTKQKMKSSPILLGSRVTDERNPQEKGGRRDSVGAEDEDDTIIVSYELLRPDQIVIIDDVNTYAQFRDILYGAPQEDILESLYSSLGSPRLGQLIKEEYKPVGELRDAPDAAKLRKLVLERLPLFLHERHQSRVLIRLEWMQDPTNFVVKKVARLILQKTLVFGGKRAVKDSEASAAAKRETFHRTLTLYIAHNIPLDLYEVANALCKQLFDTPKVNDSLLFSTILSTDLPSLRRRGYNVDRILNQQKAEREARESARRAAEREAQEAARREAQKEADLRAAAGPPTDVKLPVGGSSTGSATLPPPPPLPSNKPSSSGPADKGGASLPPQPPPYTPEAPTDARGEKDRSSKNFFNSMKNKLSSRNTADEIGQSLRSGVDRLLPNLPGGSGSGGSVSPGPQGRPPAGRVVNHQPTPESEINKNVQQAINACRPEARSLLQNRQHMEIIKEALNEGYCDVSGMEGDLVLVEIPNARELLLQTKLDSILRFLSIIRPLKRVYKLPDSSLHIFYDLSGPVIAFNANGALFLNLRYYEGWHDAQMKQKEPMKPMISWFFTLAHEIAHNLIGPHNAEHSYYMNQISQTHLLALVDELQAVQFGVSQA
ncbi:hypothetical protein FRC17_001463 [Serendipita sp. 399]|nr:hypothetical protein FRC17_001463 [Serendipita sp. 399]